MKCEGYEGGGGHGGAVGEGSGRVWKRKRGSMRRRGKSEWKGKRIVSQSFPSSTHTTKNGEHQPSTPRAHSRHCAHAVERAPPIFGPPPDPRVVFCQALATPAPPRIPPQSTHFTCDMMGCSEAWWLTLLPQN